MYEFILNLSTHISSLFVADITRCYETIPLNGDDSLPMAITHIMKIAYTYHNAAQRNHKALWVYINLTTGMIDSAHWSRYAPGSSCWIEFDLNRCLQLQNWIMLNCYICLGDEVWPQVIGILMSFSCSPLWCNLYFVSYEIKFVQRIARLQQHHLLPLFEAAYRYIDDLCILNNLVSHSSLIPLHQENPLTLFGSTLSMSLVYNLNLILASLAIPCGDYLATSLIKYRVGLGPVKVLL